MVIRTRIGAGMETTCVKPCNMSASGLPIEVIQVQLRCRVILHYAQGMSHQFPAVDIGNGTGFSLFQSFIDVFKRTSSAD